VVYVGLKECLGVGFGIECRDRVDALERLEGILVSVHYFSCTLLFYTDRIC
jgi:hypothetical protein